MRIEKRIQRRHSGNVSPPRALPRDRRTGDRDIKGEKQRKRHGERMPDVRRDFFKPARKLGIHDADIKQPEKAPGERKAQVRAPGKV